MSAIAKQRGDVFEVDLSGARAVYVVLGFYKDFSIEALRVFPDSMRVAKRPTKVPYSAAFACTLPDHKLARVFDLTSSYRQASGSTAKVSLTIGKIEMSVEGDDDDAAGDFAFDAAREREVRR